jgi:hypothetical protein
MLSPEKMTKQFSRRWWLKSMVAGASALGASRFFPAPIDLAGLSANSRLATAGIGCGGRGEARPYLRAFRRNGSNPRALK